MIIVLKNADFSASNIGTLSTWRITRSLGAGTAYDGPIAVDKEGTLTATVTIAEGYELGAAGVTITMGGEPLSDVINIQGNIIYISIPVVTGNVVIKVPTVNINTGEEDEPEVPQVVLESINISYNQNTTTIFESQDVEDLRRYLTVTGLYSDNSTAVLKDYTLAGPLQAGTSTITVTKDGVSSTFTVETTEFTLPEGYTKYGYIQRKSSTKGSSIAQENFIFLPVLENINTLSFEGRFGQKPNTDNGTTGVFGARPAEGLGYSMYWNGTDSDPFYVYARGGTVKSDVPKDIDYMYLVIDNPETSPYTVMVNNEIIGTGNWTPETDVNINTTISLFNSIPEGNTGNMYLHWTVRIGDMMFRNSNGECVAYFTPCTDVDKRIGMYDQISKTFYTASKTAAVTIGNSGVLYTVGNW